MQSRRMEEPQLPRRTRLRFWLRRLQYEVSVYQGFKHRESLPVKIVVIAVVTLLLALILFPVCMPVHGCKSRYSSCGSNQKQIALGLLMYAQDNDDYLPRTSAWMDTVNIYVKNESVLHCPVYYYQEYDSYGYAFNSDLAALQVKSWSQPERVPLVYDALAVKRNTVATGISRLANPPRHNEKNIMAFLDGHVQAVDERGVIWSSSLH